MEPVNENTEPTTYYTSVYTHGVDEKRRVQIPAKWRPAQPGTEFTLIPWAESAAGVCLRVLPPKQMAQLLKEIDAVPNGDQKKATLKRYIGSGAEQVTLDKAGRICLPEPMAKAADLVQEAVLVGMLDRFEIWSVERYKEVKIGDKMMAPEALRLLGG